MRVVTLKVFRSRLWKALQNRRRGGRDPSLGPGRPSFRRGTLLITTVAGRDLSRGAIRAGIRMTATNS